MYSLRSRHSRLFLRSLYTVLVGKRSRGNAHNPPECNRGEICSNAVVYKHLRLTHKSLESPLGGWAGRIVFPLGIRILTKSYRQLRVIGTGPRFMLRADSCALLRVVTSELALNRGRLTSNQEVLV